MLAWASGVAAYLIDHRASGHQLPVAVRCKIGAGEEEIHALLDTGAQWSVLSEELVIEYAGPLGAPLQVIPMSTRFGSKECRLHPVTVVLVADDGADQVIEATVGVVADWLGPPVLGYRGLLERLRVALDPGVTVNDAFFYFSAASAVRYPDRRLLPVG